jgi:hypothetical protein
MAPKLIIHWLISWIIYSLHPYSEPSCSLPNRKTVVQVLNYSMKWMVTLKSECWQQWWKDQSKKKCFRRDYCVCASSSPAFLPCCTSRIFSRRQLNQEGRGLARNPTLEGSSTSTQDHTAKSFTTTIRRSYARWTGTGKNPAPWRSSSHKDQDIVKPLWATWMLQKRQWSCLVTYTVYRLWMQR